jgi:hypothetical protein
VADRWLPSTVTTTEKLLPTGGVPTVNRESYLERLNRLVLEPIERGIYGVAQTIIPGEQPGEKMAKEARAQGANWFESWKQPYAGTSGWVKFGTSMLNPVYYIPVGGWAAKGGALAGGLAERLGAETLGRGIAQAATVPLMAERGLMGVVGAPIKLVAKKGIYPVLKTIAKPELEKMTKAFEVAGFKGYKPIKDITFKGEGMALPSTAEIEASLLKPTVAKALQRQISSIPIAGPIVKRIIQRASRNAYLEVGAESKVIAQNIRASYASHYWPDAMNRLNALGDQYKIWGTKNTMQLDDVVAKSVKIKEGQSPYIVDILEHYTEYDLNPVQRSWAEGYEKIQNEWRQLLRDNGIKKLNQYDDVLHVFRQGMGTIDKETGDIIGWQPASAVGGGRVGRTQSFLKPRTFETQAAGVEKGIAYNPDMIQGLQNQLKMYTRILRDEGLKTEMKPYRLRSYAFEKGGVKYNPAEEGLISHPAFQGQVFSKETINAFKRGMGLPTTKVGEASMAVLNIGARAARLFRTSIATLDLSGPFIQCMPIMGTDPFLWAKETARSYYLFFKPQNIAKIMVKPEIQQTANLWRRYGLYVGGSEYTAGRSVLESVFEKGGGLAGKVSGKPELARHGELFGRGVARQTYGRAEVPFGAAGDLMRIKLAKALEPLCKNEQDFVDAARMLNRMTGVVSPLEAGLPRTQQLFEQMTLFAPRYLRASLSIYNEIFKGGITGAMARDSLGHLAAGGMIMYLQTCKALGQEPNLDPTKGNFMTINIGGMNMGIGGATISTLKLLGGIISYTSEVAQGKVALGKQSGESLADYFTRMRQQDPALKFIYGKSSPLVSNAAELWTQKDYFGQELESPADWMRFIGDATLPMVLQSTYQTPSTGRLGQVAGLGAQFAGLRSFPDSLAERRNNLRDELAQSTYGVDWSGLDKLQIKQLRQDNSKLVEAETDSRENWIQGGSVAAETQGRWGDERDRIDLKYQDSLQKAEDAYLAGRVDNDGFKDMVDNASMIRRDDYASLEQNSDYATIYRNFDKIVPEHLFDVALADYDTMVWANPDATDEYGIYNYDVATQAEADWRAKWQGITGDDSMYAKVQEYIKLGQGDEPESVKELRKARAILKPYWQVRDYILSNWQVNGQTVDLTVWDNSEALGKLRNTVGAEALVKRIEDRLGLTDALQEVTRIRQAIRDPKRKVGESDQQYMNRMQIAYYYEKFYG